MNRRKFIAAAGGRGFSVAVHGVGTATHYARDWVFRPFYLFTFGQS